MFTFSNNNFSNSYSIRPPKKNDSNEQKVYTNIVNESSNTNNNILSIDLNSINFENTSVELALNILKLNRNNKFQELIQLN